MTEKGTKQDDVKEILDDVESLFKKVLHKVSDILVGESRKKLEKICSDKKVIVHYDPKTKDLGEEK